MSPSMTAEKLLPVRTFQDRTREAKDCTSFFVIPTDRTNGALDLRIDLTGFLICPPFWILHDTTIFETNPSIKHFSEQQQGR